MGIKDKARVISTVALCLVCASLSAQPDAEQRDSLVRLLQAKSLELQEIDGQKLRRTVDATFLHNGTYLICDTALWNVDTKVINCWGNVKLMQEETELTSDKLDYFVDDDLAQFRGDLVQLRNKKENILRTRYLDYNTRDSLAIFKGGASMRAEDGQVIESISGTYETPRKFFTFSENVNMFADSIFVRTENLTYDSERNIANFVTCIDFWKEENMLSSKRGWYDRQAELFFFEGDVHGLTLNQESWSDSLYFYRNTQNVKMLGNAQIQDSTRNVAGVANFIFYEDSLSKVTMRKDAAVAFRTEQEEKTDTLYIGSDNLTYWTTKMCDIPASEVSASKARLNEILGDPVREYRRKALEEAAEAAAQAAKERLDPNAPPPLKDQKGPKGPKGKGDRKPDHRPEEPAVDTASARADSLSSADSLKTAEPDTTRIGFFLATGRVKMYRTDMQVACDSLRYSDLDSLARLFKKPIIWNESNRQYTSDSLSVLIKNGGAERASLMSNAFIITQEDSLCYDQIKGTDVVAYFDSENSLRRFDALGGASALFFLKENDAFATVNKVESKMLSATFEKGSIDHVYYFDSPKNEAYPVVQLPEAERKMKGFNWAPAGRPKSKEDITSLTVKDSQRSFYERKPKAEFKQTDIYFPGYMASVYQGILDAQIERDRRKARQRFVSDSLAAAKAAADSLAAVSDSLAAAVQPVDSAAVSAIAPVDSVAVSAPADSLKPERPLTEKEIKARERQDRLDQRAQIRALRIARKDARWAELSARDAEKAAAKNEKKLKKKRAATLKAVLRQREQDGKDEKKLSKYLEKYEKQKARKGAETETENETEESERQPERTD